MPILQSDIDRLKDIYRRETGEAISNQEAWDMGVRLVGLFRLLLGVPPEKPEKGSNSVPIVRKGKI